MKTVLKNALPDELWHKIKSTAAPFRRIAARYRTRREFALDRRRYLSHMLPDDGYAHAGLRGRNLEAQLTKDYHRVEKGLALPAPKRPFGAEVARRLDLLLPLAPADAPYAEHARSARAALHDWNEGGPESDEVSPRSQTGNRGISDPRAFFTSRHSVRNFDSASVDPALLEEAVELASYSPSVCNRQPWRVRFFNGQAGHDLLAFQNGNAGFRTSVPTVALVTVDSRMFAGAGERNQAWIEGGIFAMGLVQAFHSLGLDSCMLNMSVDNARARAVRAHVDADEAELIIMMIAIGHAAAGHRYARSPRRSTTEISSTH